MELVERVSVEVRSWLASFINKEIKPFVHFIRSSQSASGAVIKNADLVEDILYRLVPAVKVVYDKLNKAYLFESFHEDITNWIRRGLDTAPDFKQVQLNFSAPENGELSFFIGAVKCQNCRAPRGYYMECFLSEREEPDVADTLYRKYPHPKNVCQSVKLITGTEGVEVGNCVVFFPENIKTSGQVKMQKYALFFFNKFRAIYLTHTIPTIENLLGIRDDFFNEEIWVSKCLTPVDFYYSRCIWGYLHDYFHHQGDRPFDENIALKTDRFVGLLEEIKVDSQAALACIRDHEIPYRKEIAQFILFERLFRYPLQEGYNTNFDSGTGFFLFEWLYRHKALYKTDDHRIRLELNKVTDALEHLVCSVSELEKLEHDTTILEKAKELLSQYLKIDNNKIEVPVNFRSIFDHFGTHKNAVVFHNEEY